MGNYATEPSFGLMLGELSSRLSALERIDSRSNFLGIPTAETRDSAASGTGFGLMPTPDQQDNLACPANSLLYVAYTATWQESVAGAARAALFINDTQLKTRAVPTPTTVSTFISYAGVGDPARRDTPLQTAIGGLTSTQLPTGQSYGGPDPDFFVVTPFSVRVGPAGTYSISVRFSVSSGTVTVKNRTLWAWGG